MLLYDLINHTCSTLPLFTDKFTTNQSITSVTKSGNTVTIVCNNHGLSINSVVILSGIKTKVDIASITTTDNVATAICATEHDLVVGDPKYIDLESITPEYNGIQKIESVPNLTTFTFNVSGTPIPGTGTLKTFHNIGFNGVHIVSNVLDVNTFQFELQNDSLLEGTGNNMTLMKLPRISGAADIDRAIDSYTRQSTGDLWGFLILEPTNISNNRNVNNDSVAETEGASFIDIKRVENFSLYVFIPTHDEESGRIAIDNAQELLKPIYKTLVGYMPTTIFTTKNESLVMPIGDQFFSYNGAYLIYQYQFQVTNRLYRNGSSLDKSEFMSDTGDFLPQFNNSAFKRFNWNAENVLMENVKNDNFYIQNNN